MANRMFLICKETPEELFDKLVNLVMLTHFVSTERSFELVEGLLIVETGLDLLDEVLNARFLLNLLLHLWRDLWLLCGLLLLVSGVC